MMSEVDDFVAPWVKEAKPYSSKHSDFAWQNPQIARMMSNENPLPPTKHVLDAILEAAREGNLYPGSGFQLRTKIAERVGLNPDNIVLGNGSTDVIDFVLGTFITPGDEVIIPVPTFSMYESRTIIRGGKNILVPMNSDFYWDVHAIIQAASPRTKLIFLSSPNNPTGNQIRKEDLIRILELGLPTFFDEAYYELENTPETRVNLIKSYPLLIVNRTFSKAYGLAGLRIGYLICEKKLANYLNRVRIPWNVNHLAIAAALQALEDEEIQMHIRELLIEGREYIHSELNKIRGILAFPTEGNFVLIDATSLGIPSEKIKEGMLKKGVFIRPMGGMPTMEGFVRVTVGTPDQNRNFIKVFREYIEEERRKR